MGAWGVGILEDDTALDWVEEEYSAAGVEAVRHALLAVADADANDYVEVDEGAAARCAAEIVAMAFSAGDPAMDADAAVTLGEHSDQVAEDVDLIPLALRALARLTAENSELNDLWSEGGGDITVAWQTQMAALVSRLEGAK
ncbi:MAG: DUF4259 domain-containing protein [Shimia sp.]|nr:DUF4259 domain-containing protein [Shimia sp.]